MKEMFAHVLEFMLIRILTKMDSHMLTLSVKDNSFVYPGELHILLNGYMRGGTTFMGRVLTNQKRTFSVMEPLWKLTTFGYHTIDNQLCAEVTPTCR